MYSAQIAALAINVISIYDSPQCVPLVNYQMSTLAQTLPSGLFNAYTYLYKFVPVDINTNYAIYSQTLSGYLNKNLNLDDQMEV
jgi:hypothetical protein